jgi:hypothetical protein
LAQAFISARKGLMERASGSAVLALALVHHLAIARNVPLTQVVDWVLGLAPSGVIEFVPKNDPLVMQLLMLRDDIFPDYLETVFANALQRKSSNSQDRPSVRDRAHAVLVRPRLTSWAAA